MGNAAQESVGRGDRFLVGISSAVEFIIARVGITSTRIDASDRQPPWPLLTALWALFTRMAAAGGGWRLCRSAGGVLARDGRRRAEECTLQDFLRKSLF